MNKTALFAVRKDESCPQCGTELVVRSGKHGAFLGCSAYPECNYIRPPKNQSEGNIVKILKGQYCQLCQAELALRQGRYGMFIGCCRYPECEHTELVDKPNETALDCPQCRQGKLVQRRSRFGKIFHACARYPDCLFAVNFTPIEAKCTFCHFPLLIEKKSVRGARRFCASKACGKPVTAGNSIEE